MNAPTFELTLGSGPEDGLRLEGVGLVPGHGRFVVNGPQVQLFPGRGPLSVHRRLRPDDDGGWSEAAAQRVESPCPLRVFDRLSWPDGAGGSHELRLVPGLFRVRFGLTVHTLGASADCAVPLPFPHVSQRHAALLVAADGRLAVDDLGSTNGTFLDRGRQPIDGPTAVTTDDVLFLSSYRLPVAQILPRVTRAAERLTLGDRALLIGRDPAADLVVDEPSVSWHHARLTPVPGRPGQALLEDLGSINGTFVDGERIRHREVGPGTRIGFGRQSEIVLDQGELRRSYVGDYVLQAERLGFCVQHQGQPFPLLEEVSFSVYPSEFVGLIGPSGAGKTTLLQALNGYLLPTSGHSLVNGRDLHAHYDSFRDAIGYVPQDDIIYPELTVAESLRYTARLRLPPEWTAEQIERRIDEVLGELDLTDAKHRLIGSPLKKGISGGQRKRVNLAQELLTRPSLLFLDEPTSGLSSYDTLEVMKLLRRMADQGRTILLTIHQPGIEAYRLLDNVAILGEGRLVYYGPAAPDSMRFVAGGVSGEAVPATVDDKPDEALRALQLHIQQAKSGCRPAEWPARRREALAPWEQRYHQTAHHRRYVQERKSRSEVTLRPRSAPRSGGLVGVRQWWTLLQRDLLRKYRDVAYRWIVLLQAPLVAVLLGFVFGSAAPAALGGEGGAAGAASAQASATLSVFALFMLVVIAIWFGSSNAVREIVSELAVLRRERMANLRVLPYLAAKLTVMGLLAALQCALLLLIFRWQFTLHGGPGEHYVALLLASLAGTGIGLALSAWLPSREAALAVLPLALIPQVLLGGAIVRPTEMSTAVAILARTMPSRWGFEAALHAEFGSRAPVLLNAWFGPDHGTAGAHLVVLGLFVVVLVGLTLGGVLRRE